MCAGANQEPAAGAHGRAAYLGDGAWRRFAVRAWGCGAADPADVAGRTSGGRGADLSARPGDRGGKRRFPAIACLHKVASYLTAARRDVNVIYIHKGGPVMVLVEKLDELGKPAWIALMILGFVVWWPLGLVTLAFILGSGRMAMGCWGHHNDGSRWQHNMSRWQSKMERMQEKMDRLRGRMEQRGPSPGWWGGEARSSGNRAFDDYRTETLQRLEEEQREFKEFLERLRFAKDRAEFDQFMAERRNRPPNEGPQAQPQA